MRETNCNLCGLDKFEIIDVNKNHELNLGDDLYVKDINNVVCRNCGLIYNNPILDEKDLQELYTNLSSFIALPKKGIKNPINSLIQSQYKFIIENIKIGKKTKKILDIGCSLGNFLKLFKKNGWMELGIDPSVQDTKFAKEINNINTITDFFRPGVIKNEKFDLITLRYVLEHVHNPSVLLKEIYSLLNNEGYLYIEVPDAKHPFVGFDNFFSLGHLYSYTPSILQLFIEKEGFNIIKMFKSSSIPNNFEKQFIRLLAKKARVKKKINFKSKKRVNEILKVFYDWKQKRIELMEKTKVRFEKLNERWKINRNSIYIWGAGTHTSELIKNNVIDKALISGFIDSNPKLKNKSYHSIKIFSPKSLDAISPDVIIISSRKSEEVIYNTVKLLSKNPNLEIIKIYG